MSKILHKVCVIGAVITLALPVAAQETNSPLTIAKQGSFFVGGREVHSETLSANPLVAPVGTVTVEQMYVRYQLPVGARRVPITLIHGNFLSGATWETTPDGRMGWDEYFLRKGHGVYIVDQSARARSAPNLSVITAAKLGKATPAQMPAALYASHEAAWTIMRFGSEYPKPFPGMQFPIEAVNELWKQMVPDWTSSLPMPNPTILALSELATRLDGTVLISHSQSGIYPFQALARNPKGIAAIIGLEPAACPDATADLAPYAKLPILVVWADYVDTQPIWAQRQKSCQTFADAVNKIGGKVENVELPKIGIHGNSHMLMQDRNNLAVADWLLAWIDRNTQTK